MQTQSGVMTAETGTYRWMAPEVYGTSFVTSNDIYICEDFLAVSTNILSETQVIEHKPYDHRADVFSYAIVLWELLTGEVIPRYFSSLSLSLWILNCRRY